MKKKKIKEVLAPIFVRCKVTNNAIIPIEASTYGDFRPGVKQDLPENMSMNDYVEFLHYAVNAMRATREVITIIARLFVAASVIIAAIVAATHATESDGYVIAMILAESAIVGVCFLVYRRICSKDDSQEWMQSVTSMVLQSLETGSQIPAEQKSSGMEVQAGRGCMLIDNSGFTDTDTGRTTVLFCGIALPASERMHPYGCTAGFISESNLCFVREMMGLAQR